LAAFHQRNKDRFAFFAVDTTWEENLPLSRQYGFRFVPHAYVYSPTGRILADGLPAAKAFLGMGAPGLGGEDAACREGEAP